jgi:PAS domain S-box-containing protein
MVALAAGPIGHPATQPRPLEGRGRWLAIAPFVGLPLAGIGMALAVAPSYHLPALLLAGATLAAIILAVGLLPWSRWPPGWQAVPALAIYPVAPLLEYAAGEHIQFFFVTPLPLIWLVLFHTRRLLLVGVGLLGVTLVAVQLGVPSHTASWTTTVTGLLLSAFFAFAAHYVVSRNRALAAEAHAATAQAKADRDLLNAYLANAGTLVVVVDRDGRIALFNRAAELVTGYRAEEVIGQPILHPDGRSDWADAVFRRVLSTGEAVQWEGDSVTRSGERRRIAWTGVGLTDEAGVVTHVVGTGSDLTELRRTERLFSNVLSSATEQMIMAADIHGVLTLFNQGSERMLGYAAEEVLGDNVAMFHAPEEVAALMRKLGFGSFQELLAHPATATGEVAAREWTLVRKDGSRFPAAMTVTPMQDEGELVGFVMVGRDVTVEKQIAAAREEALQHEREVARRLRELDQAKSDFVATVSHDLRTPLTSITGNTELLLDGDAGELAAMQRQLLEAVDRNARRLDTLVGDLLLLSRIESGTLRLQLRDVSVQDLVEGALEALTAKRAADVRLDVNLPGEPVLLRGDPDQLERVLTNLISNALKFTPPGGRVEVGVASGPERVKLWVSDTGIGIPETELSQIFDRFFRTSRSQEANRPGTGLGLTIVKSIVEQHRGTIAASANPDGGTTFTVTMPALAVAAASEREPA